MILISKIPYEVYLGQSIQLELIFFKQLIFCLAHKTTWGLLTIRMVLLYLIPVIWNHSNFLSDELSFSGYERKEYLNILIIETIISQKEDLPWDLKVVKQNKI